jgi:diguanylate cyclase (GGDEF)-like protein/PAS domain S-box-containing protein
VLDGEGRITLVSDSLTQVLGWAPDQVRGRTLAGLVHTGDLEALLTLLDPVPPDRAVQPRPRLRLRSASGRWRILEWAHSGTRSSAGAIVLSGRDVTQQEHMERELRHQATHDLLTGLPNRGYLTRRAEEALAAAHPDRPVAMLLLDLDGFKAVNDSLGHAAGDQLLAAVGPRLSDVLRPGDTIARLGGDEFAVLLPNAGERGALRVAHRLAAQLELPFVVLDREVTVRASIGFAISRHAGRDGAATMDELLHDADHAMYRAKGGEQTIMGSDWLPVDAAGSPLPG